MIKEMMLIINSQNEQIKELKEKNNIFEKLLNENITKINNQNDKINKMEEKINLLENLLKTNDVSNENNLLQI